MTHQRPGPWFVLAALVLSGLQPAGQTSVALGFTELLDFRAVTSDGRPVGDLTAADVALRVDGRPRAIRSLEFVELASPLMAERPGALLPPMPEPFGTNRLADGGRVVMIVMHHESIRPGRERPARDAAVRFLAMLSPRDYVGLVTMPRGSVLVDLTRDHEQVRTALSRVTGQARQTEGRDVAAAGRMPGVSASDAQASDKACGSRLTLNTLATMMPTMSGFDGPKSIVFISSGLAPPTRDAPMNMGPGQCELRSVYYEEVGTAASAARAHFYIIQPNDEQADSAQNAFTDMSASRFGTANEDLAGLQHLAGVTGGDIFRLNSQPPEAVFTRVATETGAYYMIAFEPDASERNGLAHRVEIRAARDGVVVKFAPYFTIPKLDVAELTPQKMLRTERRFRALPLRATAYVSRMAGQSSLKIVGAAEPADPSTELKSAAFGLFDAKGKLAAQTSADGKEVLLPFVAALPGAQGPYRLRFAAVDTSGRAGTVDYSFRADLTGIIGNLRASGMALGTTGGGLFTPRLQFRTERDAIALFEMYGSPPRGAELTVRLEVAPDDDDPALAGGPATIRPSTEDDSRMVIGSIAIASLPPGDYVVRALVSVDGRVTARITRTLRKVTN
jgi:VWFA-related protein